MKLVLTISVPGPGPVPPDTVTVIEQLLTPVGVMLRYPYSDPNSVIYSVVGGEDLDSPERFVLLFEKEVGGRSSVPVEVSCRVEASPGKRGKLFPAELRDPLEAAVEGLEEVEIIGYTTDGIAHALLRRTDRRSPEAAEKVATAIFAAGFACGVEIVPDPKGNRYEVRVDSAGRMGVAATGSTEDTEDSFGGVRLSRDSDTGTVIVSVPTGVDLMIRTGD